MTETVKPKISLDMVNKIHYDKTVGDGLPKDGSDANWVKPSIMMVFNGGDLNAAAYYAAKAAQMPFGPNVICTILAQESIYEDFLHKVRGYFKALDNEILKHPSFKRTKKIIERLQAKTIVVKKEQIQDGESPILVEEFTQEYFGTGPSGIVTIHCFRTAKETKELFEQEKLNFESTVIFNENMACSYELAYALHCPIFYFNCVQVPLDPILAYFNENSTYVRIEGIYHYETLNLNNKQKLIVFPIGTIFAN